MTLGWKTIGALIAVLGSLLLAVVGMPGNDAMLSRMDADLSAELITRAPHVDPAEVLDLMYDDGQQIFMIDVRTEQDYNQFHLLDVRWQPVQSLDVAQCRKLPVGAVKIVMSNDEAAAELAWKKMRAAGLLNVYVLAGGVNVWLDLYKEHCVIPVHQTPITPGGDDVLRHTFERAQGGHHHASLPDRGHVGDREFERKVELTRPSPAVGGGCG